MHERPHPFPLTLGKEDERASLIKNGEEVLRETIEESIRRKLEKYGVISGFNLLDDDMKTDKKKQRAIHLLAKAAKTFHWEVVSTDVVGYIHGRVDLARSPSLSSGEAVVAIEDGFGIVDTDMVLRRIPDRIFPTLHF